MTPVHARVGLGGAAFGVLFEAVDDSAARAAIDAAWNAGIRFFDTAPLYGGGLSETRFGAALADRPRGDYVLATKTGVTRPFGQAAAPEGGTRRAADVWDYSPEATAKSVHASLARLRTDRLDFVHLHDIEGRVDAAMAAYPALQTLRAGGLVGGIGIGANTVEAPLALMAHARFDAVLIAGRYTLLDQSMLRLVSVAREAGTRLIVGGVFNSGILATGLRPGARFAYADVPADIAERVRRIEGICTAHAVPLRAAALQFPLCHPRVDTLLLGAANAAEVEDALAMLGVPIPGAFWRALADAGLLHPDCPLP